MNAIYIESFALHYLTMKILIFRVSISIFVLYIYICEALLLKKIDINTLKMAKDDPTFTKLLRQFYDYISSLLNIFDLPKVLTIGRIESGIDYQYAQ